MGREAGPLSFFLPRIYPSMEITSWENLKMQPRTNQPIERFAWHRSCAKTCTSSFFFLDSFFWLSKTHLHWFGGALTLTQHKKTEHPGGSGLNTFCQIHVHVEKKKRKKKTYGQVCQARVVSCCSDILLLSSFFFPVIQTPKRERRKESKSNFSKGMTETCLYVVMLSLKHNRHRPRSKRHEEYFFANWSMLSFCASTSIHLAGLYVIARNFWHLRDCAWPSRAAYANPRLIADAGRRSVVRGSNAVVDREEKKRSVLSQELSLARKPFLYIYFPWFPLHPSLDDLFFWLLVEAISLSLSPTFARCHSPALTHSVTLLSSSIFFSVSFVLKRVKEGRAFVQSTHELQRLSIDHKLCSLKANAINKTIRKASTDPEKQANFLEDFSPLSRKTSTLEKTESYREKARPRRKQTRQSWKGR